jgi:hypothetical protein
LLLVTDEDNSSDQIVFTVTVLPSGGTLLKNGITIALSETFTQADVNANQISYTHDGFNSVADKFTFTVSDGAGGFIAATDFQISIDIVLSAEDELNAETAIFPMPASKEVTVRLVNNYKGTVFIRLIDTSGKKLISENVMKETSELVHMMNIERMPAGLIFVQVVTGSQLRTVKLIKN